jgi:hypothetical protein
MMHENISNLPEELIQYFEDEKKNVWNENG